MFGLLKSKISDFLGGLAKRGEEKKTEEARQPQVAQQKVEAKAEKIENIEAVPIKKPVQATKIEDTEEKKEEIKIRPEVKKTRPLARIEQVLEKEAASTQAETAKGKTEIKPVLEKNVTFTQEKKVTPTQEIQALPAQEKQTFPSQEKQLRYIKEKHADSAPKAQEQVFEKPKPTPPVEKTSKHEQIPQNPFAQTTQADLKPIQGRLEDLKRLEKKAADTSQEARKVAPKVGILSTITSVFSSNITIKEGDVADLLDTLELSLLEGDVAYEVSQDIVAQLRKKLVGASVPKSNFASTVRGTIKEVLVEVMASRKGYDLFEAAKVAQKPFKILFVGPNGAGKTTTMAKLSRHFMDRGLSCVFAASDTFRAAAIEQLEVHAQRLGIKVVKSQYGSDPASVAFDAIKYAQSHGIDIVLIDSSGRQDTNANLLGELKKIVRVASPDAKIYIGESIAGNAIIAQVEAFNAAIGLDAVILTKLDCDPKGGSAISVAKSTGVPIIFVGVGQQYTDLKPFDPDQIAQEIVAS